MIINLVKNLRNTATRIGKTSIGPCILLFEAANEIERLQRRLSVAETRNQTIRRKRTPLSLVKSYPFLCQRRR